jgi:hypothetical protein
MLPDALRLTKSGELVVSDECGRTSDALKAVSRKAINEKNRGADQRPRRYNSPGKRCNRKLRLS